MTYTQETYTAIIIAAGLGSRLKHLTADTPKCLLPIGNKSILEHQLQAFRGSGLNDIHVIKGYKAEMINFKGLTYWINDNYRNNNILNSLMYAQAAMMGPFIATYSDIIFNKDIVDKLQKASGDIVVVVDLDLQKNYVGRTDNPMDGAEKAVLAQDGRVIRIGKQLDHHDGRIAEFIGMFKCSAQGAAIFRSYFHQVKEAFEGKPFMEAKIFARAYVTDLIQYLIDHGVIVNSLTINGGWQEIDTVQDFEKANKLIQEGYYSR